MTKHGTLSEKMIAHIHLSDPEAAREWHRIKVSPDNRRVAFVESGIVWKVRVGHLGYEGLKVVVDGRDDLRYDSIAPDSLVFTQDSKRLAFLAEDGDHWLVVVDGKEGKRYHAIG